MSEIPEDKKQLIDTLTSGYAFCDQNAEEMAELIEIGRLAVEEEKLRCALKAKYVAAGGKTDGCMGLYDDFYKASITHREAVCAYLAKQEESK